ncbi:WxL protein peptidoglycan domain-containing protein [Agromyces sp. CCNWLW203]|uniref:WxL protein peptidoglycan domain-containing protein n=1 Tax=Agromyces sp. CCNWLW203 TaxID=3112842 RepID=UPI002F961FFA
MKHFRLVIASLALLGITALALPAAAAAEETETESSVTWAMSPADESGPDGRSWVELELDPGATATEHLAVRNFGDRDVTFAITAADGYFTPTGRFNMLPSDAESVDAGTWISVDEQVTVAPGGTAVLPFTIEVPGDATPGDHAAGIAASIYTESAGDGAGLGVESRVGFRVMTRVTGVVQPGLVVTPAPDYVTSWNPFEPGRVELEYLLENTGNVRLTVSGSVEHGGAVYPAPDTEQAQPIELLPGDRRTLSIQVPDVWPTVFVALPLTITQGVITPDGEASELDPMEVEVAVWAIPWPQLLIVLALALMITGLFWGRRRRTKQIEHLVDQAREAGRREAEQTVSAGDAGGTGAESPVAEVQR